MVPAICPIDEDGRIKLPAELIAALYEKGIHHIAIIETWDGYRLEPVAEENASAAAPQSRADQINSLIAAMADRDREME